jgi:hypothetical protein
MDRASEQAAQQGEQHNRQELEELMQELRIALPGVQVLFAFLLTLPFTTRFDTLSDRRVRGSYIVALVFAALASVLLIAPSAMHRLYHSFHDPGGLNALLGIANRLAILGLGCLLLAMAAALFLVADVLFQALAAAVFACLLALLGGTLWFGVPVVQYLRRHG